MIKNYFKPLLLFALLISGFSLIYYSWYFQIIYNSIDKNPPFNLFSDKVYLFSVAKIALETLAVSLILLGIAIIHFKYHEHKNIVFCMDLLLGFRNIIENNAHKPFLF
jgi:hypothetical protein